MFKRQKEIEMDRAVRCTDYDVMRKWEEAEEDCIMSSITCTLHQTLLGWSNQRG
jgi:hypothetical protein